MPQTLRHVVPKALRRDHADVIVALGLAAVGMLVVLAGAPSGVLRALMTLPLALFVPGYVWILALFPDHQALHGDARAAIIVGLNLATLVVGGIALDLTPWGLQPGSWALWLGLVTWAGSMAVLWQRGRLPRTQEKFLSRPTGRQLGNLGLLLLLGAFAVAIAIAGATASAGDPFSQLWLLPDAVDRVPAVRIGIHSREAEETEYLVVLLADDLVVRELPGITLVPGESRQWIVEIAGLGAIDELRAELYLAESPEIVYRRAHLRPTILEGALAP